jgi:hypothetical protein
VTPAQPGRAWLLLLFGLGLAARAPWLLAFPAVHGGDSVARLARSDELLLAYQLPLPQLLVFLARAATPDPLFARALFAALGAAVPVALARALQPAGGTPAALFAGLLAALHPLFVYYSLVPYQEPVVLVLLLEAAAALQRGRDGRASLCLGMACLCRYEAWIAAALAFAARRRSPARAALLFGWAPVVWLVAWRGLSPPGSYVLDLDPEAARWSRLLFLGTKLQEYTGWAALCLALAGAVAAVRRRSRALAWAALFIVLVVAAVVAAGHEFPPGSGRVSERLIHLPALAACALAGLALGALAESGRRPGLAAALLASLAVGAAWVRSARELVTEANRDPALMLACSVARVAERELGRGERLAVLAPPVSAQAIDDYVRKVERSGGDARRAREIALALARHSPDTDRVAANLARPPRSVVEDAAGAALIAVFDDAPAPPPGTTGALLARFQAGARGVSVYRSASR